MKIISVAALILLPTFAVAQTDNIKSNADKLADDPTKVITKVGISYSNTFDFDDQKVSFSGSYALDKARKINVRIDAKTEEWRVGGSWLFPVGIVNFNLGKTDYSSGASQTNYSIGTFVPLSYFGIEPAGIQIFPMAGYTYNDGEYPVCAGDADSACDTSNFSGTPSSDNGFIMVNSASSSGYLGAFALKPLTPKLTLIGVFAGSYGSKNSEGENYKGIMGGLGMGYSMTQHHSFNFVAFMQNNNTYLDDPFRRVMLSYTYQF